MWLSVCLLFTADWVSMWAALRKMIVMPCFILTSLDSCVTGPVSCSTMASAKTVARYMELSFCTLNSVVLSECSSFTCTVANEMISLVTHTPLQKKKKGISSPRWHNLSLALCVSPGQGRAGTLVTMKDSFYSARRQQWWGLFPSPKQPQRP